MITKTIKPVKSIDANDKASFKYKEFIYHHRGDVRDATIVADTIEDTVVSCALYASKPREVPVAERLSLSFVFSLSNVIRCKSKSILSI